MLRLTCRRSSLQLKLAKNTDYSPATRAFGIRLQIPYLWKSSFSAAVLTFLSLCALAQCGCEQLGLTYVGKDGTAAGKPDNSDASSGDGSKQDGAGNSNLGGSLNPSAVHRPLMVGSFNIQDFGETKSGRYDVVQKLQDIVLPYDVLAIQEIVSKKFGTIDKFVAGLNQNKQSKFSYVASPWLGNSAQVEQYAFVYDATRLEVIGKPFVVKFPEKVMSREPLVCRFQVRSNLTGDMKPFSFAVVNVHAMPEEPDAVREMSTVASVVSFVKKQIPEEDDILVMGDFNLGPDKIFEKTDFQKMVNWKAVLDKSVKTNVRETKAYDNILFSSSDTQEYRGKAGAISMQQKFTIDLDSAKKISDHRPIWAVFSLTESVTRTAENTTSKSAF